RLERHPVAVQPGTTPQLADSDDHCAFGHRSPRDVARVGSEGNGAREATTRGRSALFEEDRAFRAAPLAEPRLLLELGGHLLHEKATMPALVLTIDLGRELIAAPVAGAHVRV